MKALYNNFSNLPRRFHLAAYVAMCVVVALIGPYFLGGAHKPQTGMIFSISSYGAAASIVATMLFLSILGRAILLSLGKGIYYSTGFFVSVFVGQALLAAYFLIRSAINEYVYYLPVGLFEVLLLTTCCVTFLFVRSRKSLYEFSRQYFTTIDLLYLSLFFLAIVGVCEYEIPRLVMLSSDPDQHAFFASQIKNFGTVPFSQFNWGSLPLMYPSGTGILGWEWTAVSGLDARDIVTLLPTLQFFIGVFMILESISLPTKDTAKQLYMGLGACLLMVYVFPYGFDSAHYHQEGTGRLMSIAFYAWLMVLLTWAPGMKSQQPLSINSPIGLIIIISIVGAFSILINPVNGFYYYAISSFVFVLMYKGCIKKQMLVVFIPIVSTIFFLDPYYSKFLFFSNSVEVSGELASKQSVGNIGEIIESYWRDLKLSRPYEFFKFDYLPGKNSFVIILLMYVGISLVVGKREIREFKPLFLALLSGWLVFVILAPLFVTLSQAGPARLLAPYFSYSTFQYLFVIVIFLFISLLSGVYNKNWTTGKNYFTLLVFMTAMALIAKQGDVFNRSARIGYCGSIGCVTENDLRVVQFMESYFKDKNKSYAEHNYQVGKILLPNMVLTLGGEKWLFPTGASRMLPFYDLPPVAFFYFQGDEEFSFDNYNKYVCESFNIDWLQGKNVKYMFVPEQLLESCVANLENIIATNVVVFSSGKSIFLEFKQAGVDIETL